MKNGGSKTGRGIESLIGHNWENFLSADLRGEFIV
jgi:hypothetical protein